MDDLHTSERDRLDAPVDGSDSLRVDVLGPLEVWRGEERLELGSLKQRVVLACLAVARGRVVPTERLVDVVWGEDPPPNAVNNLQVYVSRLRTTLRAPATGTSPLVRRGSGYQLDLEPGHLDVERFLAGADEVGGLVRSGRWEDAAARAGAVLALWRGEVLHDARPMDWMGADLLAWRGRRDGVVAARVTALLGAGRLDEAVATAVSAASEGPSDDALARLAMIALHRVGRAPDALELYEEHRRGLDDHLGVEPSAELRATHLAVLRQEPWLDHWPEPQRGAAGTAPEPEPEPTPAPTPAPRPARGGPAYVGRRHELEEALAAAGAVLADDGQGRVLVLTGPAGMGKTRLAEEVLASFAAAGGLVVRGRCLDEQDAPVWWPLRQVARELGEDPDVLLTAPAGAGADTLRFTVYERVRDLLAARSDERPVAVLVDDLQWADPNSRAALGYLATALAGSRVLLLVTVRDATSASDEHPAARLLRAPGATHLALEPLTASEVADLATEVGGAELDDDEAADLAARCAGNALFVCEYARLPEADRRQGKVPVVVRTVLAQRVGALEPPVRRVLQVAATLGGVVDLPLVARMAQLSQDELLDLLDAAAEASIIEPVAGGAGYDFSHALMRDQVMHELSELRRQRLHVEAARVMTTAGAERVSQRAGHLVAAGPLAEPRDVVEACRAAALQAEERMSAETAASWWQQAADALDRLPATPSLLQERDDLVIAAVRALGRAGRTQEVMQRLEVLLGEAVRLGRTDTVGRLAATLLRISGTWPWAVFGADPAPMLAQLGTVAEAVAGSPAASARVLAALAVGRCYDPDPTVPDQASRRALDLAEEVGDPDVLADALVGRVLTYVGEAGHAEEAEQLLDRLAALPRVGPDAETDRTFAHSAHTMSCFSLGDVAQVEAHVRAGVLGCDRLRMREVRAQLRWMEVGLVHWLEGPEAALASHAVAAEAHRATELYDGGFADLVLRVLLLDAGRLHEVADFERFETVLWAAAGAWARGDHEQAARLVRRRLTEPFPTAWATLAHVMVLAHVVCELGLADAADAVVRLLEPFSGRLVSLGQGPVLGPVDAALARLAALGGQPDRARELLARARELCRRNGSDVWVARCDELGASIA
ncbi:BTAD domain-containing putative transcriptional regulator [Nocardioides marinquilinus]|uniref:BTAD domain-containing putative transcriptional regulator n=1 Tax=Nocardioides marinquilinus TaxID=1210400 RepID=A0ABP9PAH3_9ACTN